MSTKLIRKNAVRMHFSVSVYINENRILFGVANLRSPFKSRVPLPCNRSQATSVSQIVVVRRDQLIGEW